MDSHVYAKEPSAKPLETPKFENGILEDLRTGVWQRSERGNLVRSLFADFGDRLRETTGYIENAVNSYGRVPVVVTEGVSVIRLVSVCMAVWSAGAVPLPLWKKSVETQATARKELGAALEISDGCVVRSKKTVEDSIDYWLPSSGTSRKKIRWISGSFPRSLKRNASSQPYEYLAVPRAGDRVLVTAAPDGLGFFAAQITERLVSKYDR